MNRDTLEGQWKQIKGKVRTKWGKLTNDDVDEIQGKTEVLYGKLQERYGHKREQAEKEVNSWLDSLHATSAPDKP